MIFTDSQVQMGLQLAADHGLTKNQAISFVILSLVHAGADVRQATDLVLGKGTSERLANELYNQFRAMAQSAEEVEF